MNYSKIYANLISKAKNRCIEGYTEDHHIVPRCLGGSDNKENLVSLTPEEHFVAHLLLVKIYPNNHKLVFAVNMMCVGQGRRPNNKRHGWIRRKISKAISISNKGKQAWNKDLPMNERQKAKLSTTWLFTFPDGHEEIHIGLNDFCKLHGLNPSTMSAVCKGKRRHHKGFKCRKLTNISEDDNKEYISRPNKGWTTQANLIKVLINGVEYPSIHQASKALGITRNKIEELNEY